MIIVGDCLTRLKEMNEASVDCIVTSPPYYGLRDYGCDGQIGLEPTVKEYIDNLVAVFEECGRVLKDTGALWVNLGDTYASSQAAGNKVFGNPEFNKNRPSRALTKTPKRKLGAFKSKTLLGITSRFMVAMIDAGWICRNELIWHKPSCVPSSAKDRFTVDFEKLFFFVKKPKGYYFKTQYEPCVSNYAKDYRIKRTVWNISTAPCKEAHFAVFPEKLIEIPIAATCPPDGVVLDPFFGAGTTGIVAKKQGKKWIGIELNPEYAAIAEKRINQ